MSAYNAQRERDRKLLTEFARSVGWLDDSVESNLVQSSIQKVLDDVSDSPRLLAQAENELQPLYEQLRLSRSTVDRGRAARCAPR